VSQESNKTGKSNVSSASLAIIEQKDKTINQLQQQIEVIMENLRGLQTKNGPAGNASDPNTSQQPRQATLDTEIAQPEMETSPANA
jgi:hypothetical protein